MSAPIAGHPDFQTSVLWSGRKVYNAAPAVPGLGLLNLVNAPALNFAGLIISVLNASFFGTLIIQGTVPSAIAGVVTRWGLTFAPGTFIVRVPVTGDNYVVNLQNNMVAAGTVQELTIVATNNVDTAPRYNSDFNYINQQGHNVPAFTTQLFQLPAVQPGAGQFTVVTGAAAGALIATVFIYNQDGSRGADIMQVDPITNQSNFTVQLPAEPIGVALTNTTAAAIVCNMALFPHAGV
jgi:hypothetical protein